MGSKKVSFNLGSKEDASGSKSKVSSDAVQRNADLLNRMCEEAKKRVGPPTKPVYEVPKGLSQDEYKDISRNLQRYIDSDEIHLKMLTANYNKECGVEDQTGLEIIDNKLGIVEVFDVKNGGSTRARKVLRLRGGAGVGESSVNHNGGKGLSNLEKLLGSRRVDSHSMLGGSTDLMLKQGNSLLKEIDEKLGTLFSETEQGNSDLSKGAVVKNTTNVLRLRGGVSQGSDCDSDGVPGYMQENWNDDDNMEIIRNRREVEDFPILVAGESDEFGFRRDNDGFLTPRSAKRWVETQEHKEVVSNVVQSSSGGIPIGLEEDKVVVEDCVSSDDDFHHETNQEALERITVNKASRVAFQINKNEREELFSVRQKMMDLQRYLERHGLSMADFERESLLMDKDFNGPVTAAVKGVIHRDEFGFLSKPSFTGNELDGQVNKEKEQVFQSTEGVSGAKDAFGNEKTEDLDKSPKPHSWSQVVKNVPSVGNSVKLDYVPLPKGSKVVSPPDDVLRKGIDKLKCCIVGTFSKGSLPYSRVSSFAFSVWKKQGLLSVFQKDSSTFIFKFASESQMFKVLAFGTCYIDQRPMLMHQWGVNIRTEAVKNLPLWVKLEKIPDCYWTKEGISNLASAIGKPLCVDDITSRFEIMPFAKICVDYVVGDELPNKIEALEMDPVTEEKKVVEVILSYPAKPRFCSFCRALGHTIGACPVTRRHWVPKVPNEVKINEHPKSSATDNAAPHEASIVQDIPQVAPTTVEAPAPVSVVAVEEDWQTVHRRKQKSTTSPISTRSEDSPAPDNSFKNLYHVDEVEAKRAATNHLSKSQRKKQRKALGKSPQQLS